MVVMKMAKTRKLMSVLTISMMTLIKYKCYLPLYTVMWFVRLACKSDTLEMNDLHIGSWYWCSEPTPVFITDKHVNIHIFEQSIAY